ncbi:thiamine pyrophosphate-binding protein [Gryllotalpicola koreensis]|uniref:Thiamine pyrophosphate-binding protein n=1 Tax=Gryllotalpicola koreensis TaxID=993086 RepID=A0ABP8A1C6_9MICO
MPTVAHHVAAALARHVTHVFGVMGNGNAYFLDALLRETDAAYTAVRHEAGAVVAADTHFRVSGRIAAATTTYGAGFTNTLTALAEAAQARVPLVVVVGDEPTSGPRAWDVDQIALASAVGARTYTVGRVDAAATTVIALEHALSYRVPVVLALPYDIATREVGPVPELPELRLPDPLVPAPFAAASIERVARLLAEAERPFLLAGRGAWLAGAGEALGRLAAATGALTASTALGRGVFPDVCFDLGVAGGFGAPGAMELVRDADVAVVFGAGLNQFTMRFGELFAPATRVVQVDVAPAATHPHVGDFLRGDARLVAEALVEALPEALPASELFPCPTAAPGTAGAAVGGGRRTPWRGTFDLDAARRQDAGASDGRAADGRLDPRAAAARIGELLPADRVVVSDGGHFLGWSNMFWPVSAPNRLVMVGTAYQSIGLGLPSVAGAAAAAPEATIVLTSGDGGGLMALADFETAVRSARGRGLAVFWNDGAYGAEVNLYGLKGLAREPMLIPEVDFAALGRALGAEGVVVRELGDLDRLAEWAAAPASDRPFLVLDLRISRDVIAPYQREVIRVNS